MNKQKQPFPIQQLTRPYGFLLILLVLCFLLFYPHNLAASEDPEKPIQTTDSISSVPDPINMEDRLRDPDYDVRIPTGVKLQPWHDRNSMYPRRTLPITQLAYLDHFSLTYFA